MSEYFTDSTPSPSPERHHDILFITTDGIYENSAAFRLSRVTLASPVKFRATYPMTTVWAVPYLKAFHAQILENKIKRILLFLYFIFYKATRISVEITNHAENKLHFNDTVKQ
jgi:hypothetical protein